MRFQSEYKPRTGCTGCSGKRHCETTWTAVLWSCVGMQFGSCPASSWRCCFSASCSFSGQGSGEPCLKSVHGKGVVPVFSPKDEKVVLCGSETTDLPSSLDNLVRLRDRKQNQMTAEKRMIAATAPATDPAREPPEMLSVVSLDSLAMSATEVGGVWPISADDVVVSPEDASTCVEDRPTIADDLLGNCCLFEVDSGAPPNQ